MVLLVILFPLSFATRNIEAVKPPDNSETGQLAARPIESDFTMVLFPDTQYEVQYHQDIWKNMSRWVAANKKAHNIQAVIGLGDVTNQHTDIEFQDAVKGWNIIDNTGLPHVPVIGNHDYDSLRPRVAATWNRYLGVDRFSGKSWYGTACNNSTENYCIKFDVGTHKYLVLALAILSRPNVLKWAQTIIGANSDREIIVATHGYLNHNGHRTRHGDAYGPDNDSFDSQQVWDNLLKLNSNVFLTVCGHQIGGPTSAFSTDVGISGNSVHQIFLNYQNEKTAAMATWGY